MTLDKLLDNSGGSAYISFDFDGPCGNNIKSARM